MNRLMGLLAMLCACLAPGVRASARAPEVVDVRLKNGLRVLIAQQPDTRTAAYALSFAVGSADNPEGHSALAHLAEHAMFEGTPRVPAGGFAQRMASLGAKGLGAETRPDSTTFHASVPPGALDTALALEADRFVHVLEHLDAARWRHVQQIVRRENSLRKSLARRAFYEGLYGSRHPYGHLGEVASDIRHSDLDDGRWFIQHWYVPTGATLAIAGDVEPDAALRAVRAHFSPWRPVETQAAPRPSGPRETTRWVAVPASGREQLWAGWATDTRFPGPAALDLVATLLQRRLVTEADWGATRKLSVDFVEGRRGSHLQVVFGWPVSPTSRVHFELLMDTLSHVCRGSMPEWQFRQAKAEWIQRERAALHAPALRVMRLSRFPDAPESREVALAVARYERVELDHLDAACRNHLSDDRRVLLYAGPDHDLWDE